MKWLPVVLILSLSCQSRPANFNLEIEVMEEFDDLRVLIDRYQGRVMVVNFWATSCPPCIKEMPHFNRLLEEDLDLKILLVSTDRPNDLESRVYPFVKKHHILPEVVLLKDQNYSAWTEKIDESWFGALPATLIFNGDKKVFRFGLYESYDELMADLNDVI